MFLSSCLAVLAVSFGLIRGAPSEGSSGDMQDHTSNNAIPRMGRRAENKVNTDFPAMIQAELARIGKRGPPVFGIPAHWREAAKQEDKRDPKEDQFRFKKWAGSWSSLMGPQTQPVKSSDTKRAPWTGSWANIVFKPSTLETNPRQGKRSGVQEVKRSAHPNDWSNANWGNLMRTRQGFRLHDGGSDYLDNSVMYKRTYDPTMGINVVPQLGKRASEQVIEKRDPIQTDSDVSSEPEEDDQYENPWGQYLGGGSEGGLMADSSLYPPVVGPHYRAILTRVQRTKPNLIQLMKTTSPLNPRPPAG